jgi:acetoin utilization deacetylase AcuC-like enzyme
MQKIFTDARCLEHRAPVGYPEQPERLAGVLERLRESDYAMQDACSHSLRGQRIESVHDPEYVVRFQKAVDRGDSLLDSADNPLSAGTWKAANAAVDVVLVAADWVVSGKNRQALAAVRPPGHHTERHLAMGFCYFNNIAVAAEHLIASHAVERVAIFDFDVHHGNGTQHLFEVRPEVLFASTHQFPFYPGSGSRSEQGLDEGVGFTLNIPLPAGTDDFELLASVDSEIIPAVRDFHPQVLLLSAGFDAWAEDPVGGFNISLEGYRELARRLGAVAQEVCDGRVLAVLEGGYDLQALPELVEVFVRGLRAS